MVRGACSRSVTRCMVTSALLTSLGLNFPFGSPCPAAGGAGAGINWLRSLAGGLPPGYSSVGCIKEVPFFSCVYQDPFMRIRFSFVSARRTNVLRGVGFWPV